MSRGCARELSAMGVINARILISGGAELALTGGYRLAGELGAANGDHRPAFGNYERAHCPVVAEKYRIGPNVRLMIPRTGLGIATRNRIARLPVMESLAGMERIMAPRTPTPLPDYQVVLPGVIGSISGLGLRSSG
ncbi:hypothetical protein K7711_03075 [Nocardia sp. CA2R105]|uniref:hypothetical protein n=1 Tax=Nocardia coffeae TaxID=2873381 RepID=UPI001CA78037|nr:hypothetical protein [Nocardia coffeae]MBY8855450.1 hypothetical protein [Nocardia coffeae]